MMQPCSCQCGAESELKLDNGKTIRVQRLSETFLQFQAMGMPANAMVADMLAERIKPVTPLTEAERRPYKAALLREYSRRLQIAAGTQGGAPVPQSAGDGAPTGQGQEDADGQPSTGVAPAKPAVEIFSKPTCPYTRGLKRKLDHERVTYVEYDVQSDPAMMKLMLELNGGQRYVPTVRQGYQVTVGFHGH